MRRCNVVSGVVFSFWLAFLPTTTKGQFAPAPGVSLSGTVFAEGSAERVENATVTLCDDQGNRLAETQSGSGGEFSFPGVRPRNYRLKIFAEGFDATEVRVDLNMNSQRGLAINLQAMKRADSAIPDHPTISAHELAMPEVARELVTSGRKKLYNEKNARGALNDFQTATRKAPGYYEAHYQTGMAYLALQNDGEAENEFRKAAELSGRKFADADIALGTLLLSRRETGAEGEALLRQGLALNPQSWAGQIELGKLELSRGRLDQAKAAAEKAEKLAPQQPMAHRLLALVQLQDRNYLAALCELNHYIQLDPDSPAGVRAKEMRGELEARMPAGRAESCTTRNWP